MGGLRAVVGEMMGKVPKVKGKAESEESRGGEILDVDEGMRAGCRTVVGAELVEGTRTGSEWGVALPLRLPGP